MTTESIIWVAVVIAAVVAVAVVGYLVLQQQRRHKLRERFGPEYDRTVEERENRRAAEQELRAREERVAGLDIRPLAPQDREAYAAKWTEVQERFVDAPGFAVTEADQLVASVMRDRGYPTENFEQRLSDLSVAHGRTLDHYRKAHEISGRAARREATTEELRQAMVHYRALFEELLVDEGPQADGRTRTDARDEGDVDTTTGRHGRSDGHVADGYNGNGARSDEHRSDKSDGRAHDRNGHHARNGTPRQAGRTAEHDYRGR